MKDVIYPILVFFLWASAIPSPAQQGSGFVVIVNSANDATEMDRKRVGKLFLKQIRSWDDGVVVAAVDQDPKSEVREAFTQAVHGRKISAIKSYWQRMTFSGRAVPPPELDSDAGVIAFVRSDPGGIGYVSPGTELGDGVKELELTAE